MAGKFKKDPNKNLSGGQNSDIKGDTLSQNTANEQQNKKEGGKSNPPQKKPKYLQLNITDYQDYISLMAEHEKTVTGKYMSMTKYILQLIEADKQKNIELYTKLENIEKMKREII